MPIELLDEAGNEIDLDKADGGTLRKKLEEALAQNKTLAQQVATAKATEILASMETSLVKPEDLAGVAPDQIEAKAKELHEQRVAERTETVKGILADRGLEGDELDRAVEDFLSGEGVTPTSDEGDIDVDPDFGDLPKIGGTRPSNTPKAPDMSDALGNLTSHFEEQEKASGRRK